MGKIEIISAFEVITQIGNGDVSQNCGSFLVCLQTLTASSLSCALCAHCCRPSELSAVAGMSTLISGRTRARIALAADAAGAGRAAVRSSSRHRRPTKPYEQAPTPPAGAGSARAAATPSRFAVLRERASKSASVMGSPRSGSRRRRFGPARIRDTDRQRGPRRRTPARTR